MSISAYVGLPGHGKSYGVVQNVILPALKEKRPVFTNIPMNDDKCLNDFGMTVTPFDVVDIVKNHNWWTDVFQSGAVFVLDEVWRLWPAGLKANNVREEDKAFLAEHRHMVGDNGLSTEIYLVTQDLGQIAAFARALVETTYRVFKLSNIGFDKTFRVDIYSGAISGPKPPASALLRQMAGKFNKDIYQYYKSHTKSKTGEAGDETRTDKRANGLARTSIKVGMVFFVLLIFFVFWGGGKVKDRYSSSQEEAVTVQQSQTSGTAQQPQTPRPKPKPKEPEFLSKSRFFFVSWTLGSAGDRQYFFAIEFDDYQVHMTQSELELMGYKSTVLNDCLVKFTGHDFNGFAMCGKRVTRNSFLENVVRPSPEQSES